MMTKLPYLSPEAVNQKIKGTLLYQTLKIEENSMPLVLVCLALENDKMTRDFDFFNF